MPYPIAPHLFRYLMENLLSDNSDEELSISIVNNDKKNGHNTYTVCVGMLNTGISPCSAKLYIKMAHSCLFCVLVSFIGFLVLYFFFNFLIKYFSKCIDKTIESSK